MVRAPRLQFMLVRYSQIVGERAFATVGLYSLT